MNIYRYYEFLQTPVGKWLKDFLNSLIPGIMKEPAPVRVPVGRGSSPVR